MVSITLEPIIAAVKLSEEYFQWNRGRKSSTGLAMELPLPATLPFETQSILYHWRSTKENFPTTFLYSLISKRI
jgi:hypothetical protein